MTPEELFEKISKNIFNWQVNKNEVIELIRKVKKDWCRKQREGCADIIINSIDLDDSSLGEIQDEILNAPEPE